MSADTTGDGALVLVDDPAPARVRRLTLNRPEKRNAISNAPAHRALRRAARGRPRPRRRRHRDPRRGPVLLVGLRPQVEPVGGSAVLHGARRRGVVTPRRRRLVAHLGPRQAGDRAGARLRDGGRHRAHGRVRPRVHRRRRAAQLPGRARGQPARLPVPRVAGRHAPGDGAHAHRRRHRRTRGRPHRHGQPRVPRGRPRARDVGDGGARGVDPERPAADQQAHRAPGDGVQGRAHRDACGLRAAGTGEQPGDVEAVLRRRPVGRGQAGSPDLTRDGPSGSAGTPGTRPARSSRAARPRPRRRRCPSARGGSSRPGSRCRSSRTG